MSFEVTPRFSLSRRRACSGLAPVMGALGLGALLASVGCGNAALSVDTGSKARSTAVRREDTGERRMEPPSNLREQC